MLTPVYQYIMYKEPIAMKKTLTVNLGGTVFHIDEDAYRLLDNYLGNLKLHFSRQAGVDEIVNDIELRISELFSEKLAGGSQVITLTDVEEVIKRMGRPEEMETDADDRATAADTHEDTASSHASPRRRLYRHPDDKILGGVIGGLSAYLGWDSTWFRLIFVFCTIFGFKILLPLYIIFWIVVPEARTAAERLSMRGEAVTVENIGKTVTDGFDTLAGSVNDSLKSGKPRTVLQNLLVGVGWFLKVCLVIVVIICSPVLFVLGIVFVALLFAAIAVAIGGGAELMAMFPDVNFIWPASPLAAIVLYIAGILAVSIPLVALLFAIFRPMLHWQPMTSGLKWTLLTLWIVSVVVFFICYTVQDFTFPELLMRW